MNSTVVPLNIWSHQKHKHTEHRGWFLTGLYLFTGLVFAPAFWSGRPPLSKPNRFKYNGKEQQTEFDLNWYDYGARNYDAELGRFLSVDPMADQRNWLTAYNYVQNNPMIRIDPTGAIDDYYDENLNYLGSDGKYQGIRIVSAENVETVKSNLNGSETTEEQRKTATKNSDSYEVIEPLSLRNNEESYFSMLSKSTAQNKENAKWVVVNLDEKTISLETATGYVENSHQMRIPIDNVEGSTSVRAVKGSNGRKRIAGIVHTHPPGSGLFGVSTEDGTSDGDKTAAQKLNAPVYAIGPKQKIYKVDQNGKTSSFPIDTRGLLEDALATKGGKK